MVRESEGRLNVEVTNEGSTGTGALGGLVLGAVLGMILFGPVAGTVFGAASGALAGRLHVVGQIDESQT